jgi:hypothetical protein
MKTGIRPILIAITLLFPGFLARVQGVIPAPDGCYPNYTTAEACNALSFLSTGAGNTALGWCSLFLDSNGSFNAGIGGGALALNNALGAFALFNNTTGSANTAVGSQALQSNTIGTHNTAIGYRALFHNSAGNGNTAVGYQAGMFSDTGSNNVYIGAGMSGVAGESNTAYIASIFWTSPWRRNRHFH